MTGADVRATVALVVAAFVGLFGELWFSGSYLGAGILLTAVAVWIALDPDVAPSSDEWAGLAFIAWGAVTAILASQAWWDSKTTLASWLAAWLIWFSVSRGTLAGRRIMGLILCAAAGVAAGAVIADSIGLARPGAGGLASNPNLTVALIGSALALIPGVFRRRWLGRGLAAIAVAAILLTGSRAGILAVGAVMFVMVPAARQRRALLTAGAFVLVLAMSWRLLAIPDSLAWQRWRIWGAVVEMIADNAVFGIGAGHLGQAMGPYRLAHTAEFSQWGHVIGAAESMALGVLARVGVPGLLCALAVIGLWLRRCRSLTPTRVGVLAAIAVIGLFHDLLSEPAALWWWAAAIALVTPRPPSRKGGRTEDRGWRTMFALAVAGIVAWALLQPAWAMRTWLSSLPASSAVERAVRIEPWFPAPMKSRVEQLLRLPVWTWDQASEARYWSDRLLEVQPGAAWAWDQRGVVDSRVIGELGAWNATITEARSAFATAAALEPRLPWSPYHCALMERSLGRTEEARGLIVRAVESEPNFVRGWLLLARLELDRGDVFAARQARTRALRALELSATRARTAYHRDLAEYAPAQLQALAVELP